MDYLKQFKWKYVPAGEFPHTRRMTRWRALVEVFLKTPEGRAFAFTIPADIKARSARVALLNHFRLRKLPLPDIVFDETKGLMYMRRKSDTD